MYRAMGSVKNTGSGLAVATAGLALKREAIASRIRLKYSRQGV